MRHTHTYSCRLFSRLFRSYFSFFFPGLVWSGLFCCVLVPDTLAFHLTHLDYCGCFVFSLVSQSVTTEFCISLGSRISMDTGCTDVVG